jgi:hypothetical protein
MKTINQQLNTLRRTKERQTYQMFIVNELNIKSVDHNTPQDQQIEKKILSDTFSQKKDQVSLKFMWTQNSKNNPEKKEQM